MVVRQSARSRMRWALGPFGAAFESSTETRMDGPKSRGNTELNTKYRPTRQLPERTEPRYGRRYVRYA